MDSNSGFTTDSMIPVSGIYGVSHNAHRLPREVMLIEGERFPRCSKCSDAVTFALLHAVRSDSRMLQVHIYELPVMEDGNATAAGESA